MAKQEPLESRKSKSLGLQVLTEGQTMKMHPKFPRALIICLRGRLSHFKILIASLKNVWKSRNRCFQRKMSISNYSKSFLTHWASNNCLIWTQKGPKKASRCGLQTFIKCFSKLFCWTWNVGFQKFVQYIYNTYVMYTLHWTFFFIESVSHFIMINDLEKE